VYISGISEGLKLLQSTKSQYQDRQSNAPVRYKDTAVLNVQTQQAGPSSLQKKL